MKKLPERCPDCGESIISIDEKIWRCMDGRTCGWEGEFVIEKKYTFKIEFTETCDTSEHAKDLIHDTISVGIKSNEIDSWLVFVSEEEVSGDPTESGKGDLPTTCPNCNAVNVDWDWDVANFYDKKVTNKATCPECDAVFEEVMEVTFWRKKIENPND